MNIREYVMARGQVPHETGDYIQVNSIKCDVNTGPEAKDAFEKMTLAGGLIGVWIISGQLYMVGAGGVVVSCAANLQL